MFSVGNFCCPELRFFAIKCKSSKIERKEEKLKKRGNEVHDCVLYICYILDEISFWRFSYAGKKKEGRVGVLLMDA